MTNTSQQKANRSDAECRANEKFVLSQPTQLTYKFYFKVDFTSTMANLLPSLSSDEEENNLDDVSDEEDDVNNDFSFGGVLVSRRD